MREIKFRAWDKVDKEMYYNNEFGGSTKDGYRRIFYYFDETGLDVGIVSPSGDSYLLEKMQYTGLKDKNGKEIYEGDILQDRYGKIDKVIYREYMFDLENFYDTGYDIANEAFSEGIDKFEVIGNIYENPEL